MMTGAQLYRRLLTYAWKYKSAMLVAVLFMPLASLGEVGLVYITKVMMDDGFVGKNQQTLILVPFALIALMLVRGIAAFVAQWSVSWVGRRIIFDIRNQLFSRMIRLPTRYYDENASSSLISKLIYDVEQLAQAATSAIFIFVKDGLTVISLIVWMGLISWKLTLIFLVVSPVAAVVVRFMSNKLRNTSKAIQESMSGIVKVTQEATSGHRVIKTFTAEDYEAENFSKANNHNRQQVMKQVTIQLGGSPVIEFVVSIAVATVVYVALYESIQGRMSAGEFTSYLSSMMLMLAPARRLTNTNHIIQRGLAATQSAFSVLDEEPEPDHGVVEVDKIQGRIEYRNVGFSYHTSDRPVLHDVSFTIEPGTMVALVGASGSGKSTIASLLPRFYEVEQGSILLDGHNINDFKLNNLREHVALISQDTILFDDTIANNITYGESNQETEAGETRLIRAARAAHVLEFTDLLPNRLDTMVGEKGVRLSGGQRQRIAIARAIYKDAPILIMDEATSALDTESERHVQSALEELMRNRSTLVIAHRLSTVEKADNIIVMDNGVIVESGTHQQLIDNDGAYARLHQLQFSETPAQV